jgi:hypothetical protein
MPRPLARRFRRSTARACSSATASEQLRRRVLSSVRGEPKRGAQTGSRAHGWAIVAGAALAVTIAAIATVALDRGSPAHRPVPPTNATHASLRQTGSGAELVVTRMPEPPIGEVYEVWLDHGGSSPRPTDALFTVTRAGDGSVDVPGPLRGVRAVVVTSEPLGGSSTPTSAPVLRLRVGH